MSEPFLAELRIMSFSFPPKGWAFCNGQLLPINQNQALFALLGTTYGGNGTTNFALPDLRGRVPMHTGNGHTLGERAGEQTHTLSSTEIPAHTHAVSGTNSVGDSVVAGGNLFANVAANLYAPLNPPQPVVAGTVSNVGGSQAHENMSPYLTLSVCIALQGIFPSQS